MTNDERLEFEVGPASELQKKYGWYAENRSIVRVEPSEVPSPLQDLIAYVERWAINCDVTRHDYFDKQPVEDVRDLARTIGRRQQEINAWLDSIRKMDAPKRTTSSCAC